MTAAARPRQHEEQQQRRAVNEYSPTGSYLSPTVMVIKRRTWVGRTLAIYREALSSPSSHASKPELHRRIEAEIRKFQT